MSSRADAVNRVVLTLLGLLLLAAGGLGLALSLGAFGAWRATYPVLPQRVSTFPDGRPWFWWAVAGVLLLIAVLALLWLFSQLRTHRTSRWDRTTNAREGFTTLHASALTDAVEDEAVSITGVTGVSAHVRDRHGQHVFLRVELADSADIPEVRARLESDVVAHLREGVGDPGLPVTIELRPSGARTPRRTLA
ncbi:alkaline shock response membrane anchor protein AmaP [Nocardioides mesophilus]|uniref:Alkaline shock response membrane anchor protein AmaP n=1 Tax=Nocardioides mesophilus TaxID=433659 RepID=A0A7G9R7H5_9ACTN|nr:alkaline shock response membrane anchor protein AmaP [Nocardioides mesophilus]QNN51550.1 alkaline shock response membrane anchor protein AmaP [Nocardioides mesophilus]